MDACWSEDLIIRETKRWYGGDDEGCRSERKLIGSSRLSARGFVRQIEKVVPHSPVVYLASPEVTMRQSSEAERRVLLQLAQSYGP